jgi:hypothetical protein
MASFKSVATRLPQPASRRDNRSLTMPVPHAISSTRTSGVTGTRAARSSAYGLNSIGPR